MNLSLITPSTALQKLREYTRLLWVRVVIIGFLAFVALGLAMLFEAFIPDKLARSLDGAAADGLLQIIASAMLAVTTFSLSVMVTIHRASSNQWTPRVHRLIIQDRTTQNTLAVFIGAYVYAMVAIILREFGVFNDERSFALFVMTVGVMAVIVIYLIRWVIHLQGFGSLSDVTRQVEDVTCASFRERLSNPCLGATALTGEIPEEAEPILAEQSGYIQVIYPDALNDAAKAHGVALYFTNSVGHFIFVNEPLIMAVKVGEPESDEHDEESLKAAVRDCVQIGDLRTYDQDPRFGLLVLSEVGSKALSPGVNDPGTAIDVITRVGRILSLYKDEVTTERETKLEALFVRPLDPGDLIEDAFGAMARDGVDVVEVQQRLQSVLNGLMRHPDDGLAEAARAAALKHLRRAHEKISFAPDWEALARSARADILEQLEQTAEAAQ